MWNPLGATICAAPRILTGGHAGPVRKTTVPLAHIFLLLGIAFIWGRCNGGTFQNPLNSGPDPYCEFFEGNYYLTTTQRDTIRMWKSPSLGGLKTASPVTIWTDTDPSR